MMDWKNWWALAAICLIASMSAGQDSPLPISPQSGSVRYPDLNGYMIVDSGSQAVGNTIQISAGADAIFLVPRFESNPAFTASTIRVGPGGFQTTTRRIEEFSYDAAFTPRLWAGVEYGGMGVRLSWLGYDQSAQPKNVVNASPTLGSPVAASLVTGSSPLLAIATQTGLPGVNSIRPQGSPLPPDRLSFTSSLELSIWDLDATFSDLQLGLWSFTAYGGLRYVYVQQTYNAFSAGLPPQQLLSSQTFNGYGPSLGVSARRPFSGTGLSAYGSLRFAFLFGSDEHVSQGQTLGLVPPFNLSSNDDSSSRIRYAPWVDVEMGLEWAKQIGSTIISTHAGVFSSMFPLGSGSNGNGNIGLLGLSLGGGIRY
ncbi:MAG: hypothetical protein K8T89_12110 [Planctomycetes bacterium]|nr:hypothetical protein [Planctomycetota bacterium]